MQSTPSLQSASTLQQPAIGGKVQAPVVWLHVLVVQTSLSSQTTAVPGWHSPVVSPIITLQVSLPLQASPSSQSAFVEQQWGIGACTQPPAPPLAVGSQLSVVQSL